MNSHFKAMVLALPLLVLLAGCAQNPVTGRQDFVMMTEAQELSLGRQADQETKRQYALYDLHGLAKYVDAVGQRLAQHSHRNKLRYSFTVIDSSEVNAFALPGGHIYITRGILAFLNSEAELAAVLAHEIGHVTARHSVRQISAAKGADLALSIASIFSPALRDQNVQSLTDLLGSALLSGYGREHELEADRLGAEYLSRAGYDTDAMMRVIRALKNQELFDAQTARQEGRAPRAYHGLFASHPDNDTRLKRVIADASRYPGGKRDDGRAVYLEHCDGLVYGDSADQGVIRAGQFYHGELGMALRLPQSWRATNLPDKLVVTAPDEEARLEMIARNKPAATPQEFLRRALKLGAGDIDISPINGLQAAVLATQGRLFAAVYLGDRAYLFAGAARARELAPRHLEAMRASIGSFRAISAAERKLARPLSIKLLTADAGTRFAGLARGSPLGSNAEGTLRLINALYPAGEPKPGQTLKVVK